MSPFLKALAGFAQDTKTELGVSARAEKFKGEPVHKSSKQKSSGGNLDTKVQSREVQGKTWSQKFKGEKFEGEPEHKSSKQKSSRGNLDTKV